MNPPEKNTADLSAQQRAVLSMALLSAYAVPIMLSASNVALPRIGKTLQVDAVLLSWIPMAYLIGSAMFVLVFGRLADMYGRKRIFIIGNILVITSSMFVASMNSGEALVLGRFFQGISVAMLYATQVALVSAVAPPQQRGRYIGITTSLIYLGLSTGPIFGGFVTDLWSWRMAFLVHIPFLLVVLLLALFKTGDTEWRAEQPDKFDRLGTLLYMLGMVSLGSGLGKLPAQSGWVLLILALFFICAFYRYEKRHPSPLLNVQLFFSNKLFTRSSMAAWCIYVAIYSNVVLVALYLQYLKGISATVAGLIMMTQPLSQSIISPLSGYLSDRLLQPRTLGSIGIIICCCGLYFLSRQTASDPIWQMIAALTATGIGVGLFTPANHTAIIHSVSKKYLGVTTACITMVRMSGQLGSMAVVSVVFAFFFGRVIITTENYATLATAFQTCLSIAAALCIPALYCSLRRGKVITENAPG